MRVVHVAALLGLLLSASIQFAQVKDPNQPDRAQQRVAVVNEVLADIPNLKLG